MAYGFKAFDPDGNIICDGSSEMLRLHAYGSISVGAGSTGTFYFSPLSKAPAISVQVSDFPHIYKVTLTKDGSGKYNGVSYYNGGSTTITVNFVVLRR